MCCVYSDSPLLFYSSNFLLPARPAAKVEDDNNWSDDDASEGSRDDVASRSTSVSGHGGRGGRGDKSHNKVDSLRCVLRGNFVAVVRLLLVCPLVFGADNRFFFFLLLEMLCRALFICFTALTKVLEVPRCLERLVTTCVTPHVFGVAADVVRFFGVKFYPRGENPNAADSVHSDLAPPPVGRPLFGLLGLLIPSRSIHFVFLSFVVART